MEKAIKKRDESLDIAKGILIFFVVWAHSTQFGFGYEYGESYQCLDDYVFRAICSFHMPLFMAISGYLYYSSNKKSFKDVVTSRLKSIGIPYLTYCTLNVLLLVPMMKIGGAEFILSTYKNGFWFLTSVLLNCVVVSIVTLISRNKWVVTVMLLMINLGLFFVDGKYLYDTHNYMFTCFIVGYLYNQYLERPMAFRCVTLWGTFLAIVMFLISAYAFEGEVYIYSSGVHLIRDGELSIHQLLIDVKRCSIAFVASISVLYCIQWCKKLDGRILQMVCLMSKYSIAIYCMSNIVLTVYYKVLGNLHINIPHNYILPILLAILTVAGIVLVMKRYEKERCFNMLFLGGR